VAWKVIYEDLSVFSSEATDYRDLPLDGLQAVIVDREIIETSGLKHTKKTQQLPYAGMDCCGFSDKELYLPRPKVTPEEMKRKYPQAHVVRGKTTSTRQFHKISVMAKMWSPDNKTPFEGWEKDVIGWKLWTEDKVFKNLTSEDGWVDAWKNIPDGVQGVMLYENWKTGGGNDYRQFFAGRDRYFIAPSEFGVIFSSSNDDPDEILSRYPGAVIREGSLLPDDVYKSLQDKMFAATL
jgi:hypothetical protein